MKRIIKAIARFFGKAKAVTEVDKPIEPAEVASDTLGSNVATQGAMGVRSAQGPGHDGSVALPVNPFEAREFRNAVQRATPLRGVKLTHVNCPRLRVIRGLRLRRLEELEDEEFEARLATLEEDDGLIFRISL